MRAVLAHWVAKTEYHTRWLVNSRHLLLTVLEARSPSSVCLRGVVLVRALLWIAGRLTVAASSYGGCSKGALWRHFSKGTNPTHEGPTPMTQSPPKGPTFKCRHIRISTYECQGVTNIQTKARAEECARPSTSIFDG